MNYVYKLSLTWINLFSPDIREIEEKKSQIFLFYFTNIR